MTSAAPVRVPVGDRTLDAYLARPGTAGGRHPGVIVIHEIFGPDAHIQDVAGRFAKAGYVTIAPNLFTGPTQELLTPANIALVMPSMASVPPEVRRDPTRFAAFAATQPPERRPILEAFGRVTSPSAQAGFAQDLLGVARHLRGLADVDPHRTGVVGFCFGGAMAGRLATVDPELRAAVIFYGQNPPLDDVPKVRAAVLGLYGGEDTGITATVPLLTEAMQRAGRSFASHVYPGAKHAFFNDARPNYNEAAARDAWVRVLAFLGDELGAVRSA